MKKEEIRRLLAGCDGVSVMREVLEVPVVRAMLNLLEALSEEEISPRVVYRNVSDLLTELAAQDELLLTDVWRSALVGAVLDSGTLFGEKSETDNLSPFVRDLAGRDLTTLRRLFDLDSGEISQAVHRTSHEIEAAGFSWTFDDLGDADEVGDLLKARREAAANLSNSGDWSGTVGMLAGYFSRHGAGEFGRDRAFRWRDGELAPVERPDPTGLEDLFGYERERGLVYENTRRFLAGLPAHHTLLYGPPGTGKSATVKAVARAFSGEGLRLVEVSKDALDELPELLEVLRRRGLRFVVFVDDLSFEEGEVEYKSLKAVIEGSVESPPENVRLYATSNRRNLVRETFSEREGDDVHARDTMQEKLSLAARFGLRVTFPVPDRETYLKIVSGLSAARGIRISDEELEAGAMRREQWAGGKSARSARQYVDELETGSNGGL